jgi:hypothetical protein
MVGGVVKRGKCSREIKLEYSYDRLSSEKIMQAYRLLVPEKIWEVVYAGDSLGEKFGGTVDEAGSDLCASVFGPAKRGTYDW